MANGHGGKRTPAKPAPVSGPGRLSRRTDGGPSKANLPDAAYGEQGEFQDIQSGAPMGDPGTPGGVSAGGLDLSGLTPLDAPSSRPDEPVTAGAALGPGVGPDAIGLDDGSVQRADVEKLRPYIKTFIAQANDPNSTQAFRNWVRQLRAELRA